MAAARPWSDEDNRSLIKGRIHGVSWETLADEFRRTRSSCKQQLHELRSVPAYAALVAKVPVVRSAAPARAAVKSLAPTPETIDRDRRRLLGYARDDAGDVTATFFGDPLPGYSALDRKLEVAR